MKWTKAGEGVIPAWVADMDFPVASVIVEAVRKCAEDGLVYPAWSLDPGAGPLAEAFAERMESRYGWLADPSHVWSFTDVNQSLQVLLHVLTRPGDRVALHVPTYPPFLATLARMGRPRLDIPLVPQGDSWVFDLDRLRAEAADCRVLLLVNPHNPTGRVFTLEELTGLAEVAERHDLLVISDEIHADLVYGDGRHIPFATLLPERTITVTSATKAFNMGGIRCSVAHLGAPAARKAMAAQPPQLYGATGVLGVAATVAAWRHGEDWLAEVREILDRNRLLLAKRLPPKIDYRPPEATYLAWLDMRGFALDEEPAEFLTREAKVLTSPGRSFGPGGEGFVRLNFATSAPILEEIMRRISDATTRLQE